MAHQFLTDRSLAQSTAVTPTTLIHIVTTGDTSQNPAGSSYKATLQQVGDALSGASYNTFTTGGTYDNGTALITFTKNNATTYSVDLSSLDLNDTFVTGGTYSAGTATFTNSTGGTFSVTGFTEPFTGNTSGDCITDLFVSNIHSCSPLNINPLDEGNVYFGSTSGVTIDLTNNYVGVGESNPDRRLVVSGSKATLYVDTDEQDPLASATPGNRIFFEGNPSGSTRISFGTETNVGVTIGQLGSLADSGNLVFGNPLDSFIYSNSQANNLNIITSNGSGKEDSIRFYAKLLGNVSANTSSLHIQGSGTTKGYIGINNDNPTYRLDISGTTGRLWYDGDSDRNQYRQSAIVNQGPSTGITAISVFSEVSNNSLEMFSIGSGVTTGSTWQFAGQPGDVALYASTTANNLNIMNNAGVGTTDNIRFYVGGNGHITGQTSAIHIQGSGTTRGYVGIGIETPTEKLDVSGKTKTINFQMTSGATSGYVLRSLDNNGNAYWDNLSCDCTLTGGTISGETTFTGGLSATTFTGNTIWTDRIKGRLGQLKINDGDEGNVYFGSTSGITLDVPNSRIGIKTENPTTELDVSGKTKTVNFQMTSGATNGYVLTSDASGNASWQVATSGVWSAGTGTNSAVLNNSGSVASGTTSVAEGLGTIAGGDASHAEGILTIASGNYSHAEGQQTIASGDYSHAEGNNTIASGNSSHAEGILTIASGNMSHAEGGGTVASGTWSHAGGFSSTASGSASFIHSTNSLVTGARSVVLGGQNITGSADDTVYVPYLNIDSIGTGTSVNNLGIDVNGNVVTGTAGGGIPEATTATTTTINFTGQTIYYNAGSPGTGNISENLTGAKLGLIQKIYHNDGTEPTYPAGWVLMGDAIYFTSTLNIIYAEWAGGTRVEYWYVQEQ